MTNIAPNEAGQRVARVLHGRPQLAWGKRVHIQRNTVARMLRGEWPDAETLAPCCRIEGVSLSWMVAGIGPPFAHQAPGSDQEAWRLLKSVQRDGRPPWMLYAVTCATVAPLLIVRVTHREVEPDYEWHQAIILRASVLTPMLLRDLGHMTELCPAMTVTVNEPDTLRRIAANEVGSFELFGDETQPGLLQGESMQYAAYALERVERAIWPGGAYRIAEKPATELQQRFERCTPDQQKALLEILRGLNPY